MINIFFSTIFWGILLLIFGAIIIIRVFFKINFPFFKVLLGSLLIYFGLSILLTTILWVILIGLPTSTRQSTLPCHSTTFPTELPSVIKVKWYPTCILELSFPSRRLTNNKDEPTLSPFQGLFKDDIPPNVIYLLVNHKVINFQMDNNYFKELFF